MSEYGKKVMLVSEVRRRHDDAEEAYEAFKHWLKKNPHRSSTLAQSPEYAIHRDRGFLLAKLEEK